MSMGLRVALVPEANRGAPATLSHVDELRARGHEVIAVLPARDDSLRAALAERRVLVVDSPFDFRFRPARAVPGLVRFRRLLRELAPDVLHYRFRAAAVGTRLAGVRLGVPCVHQVAAPPRLESPLFRAVEGRLARLDTVTIAPSEFTARCYRSSGRTGAQTPVIPAGVDLGHFRPLHPGVRTRVRDSLGIGPGEFVAIMVARVHEYQRFGHPGHGIKGHDVLLDAWRGFHAECPGSRLVLLGGGCGDGGERHRRELIDRFRTEDPGSGVSWIDTVDDVRPYYAAADVSVFPARLDHHGAAREACAMGVPTIVSDAGALPSTVEPRSGWIFRSGDSAALACALRAADAEHRRGELAARGEHARRLAVRCFDESRTAAAVADVIERVAKRVPTVPDLGPRVISMFTESHFGRRPDGRWTALDPTTWGRKWDRFALDGNQVRVIGRADQRMIAESAPVPGGITVLPLPWYTGAAGLVRRFPSLVRAVARAVVDADTIVLRVPGVVASIAAYLCVLLRRAYAVEVVGDPADVLRAGVCGALGRRLAPVAEAQQRWLVRRAAASLYVTHQTLQRRYPRRPGTPTVGMSNVLLRPGTLATHGRTWQPAPFRIVAMGSQENHYKGHDVLLRALRELVDDGLDATATIVGGGRLHGELIELAHSLGLAARVVFTGVVDDRACTRELLDSASVFALPSRAEGMPRALIEAMARALPAVGSRVGGVPELLPPSCLVPVDDQHALARAIGELLTDQRAWEEQSRANLKIAQTFEQSLLEHRFSAWLDQLPPARHGP
ncbi:MAG TPA: glycosyltransferase [Amycolatopsis sp.]|nr:glycosyltransferase [Amycolatopsis sp.]